jgi:hypothetical protein
MGAFYANITVASNDTDGIIDAVRELKRDAYVAPAGRFTVVYDSEEQSERPTVLLLTTLTKRFDCAAIAVCIADDDVMFYLLADRGRVYPEYNSNPAYDTTGDAPPKGGDAKILCAAFGKPGQEALVESILRRPGPIGETQRHHVLAEALDLPMTTVAMGYTYIVQGEAEDMGITGLVPLGGAPQP